MENDAAEFAASMATVDELMTKAQTLGARQMLLSLHRTPETNYTGDETRASFETTLRTVCAKAAEKGLDVLLRPTLQTPGLPAVATMIEKVAAPNLRLAPSIALLIQQDHTPESAKALLENRVGLWLASAAEVDLNGTAWTAQASLHGHVAPEELAPWLDAFPETPLALDGVYEGVDAEYRDIKILETAAGK